MQNHQIPTQVLIPPNHAVFLRVFFFSITQQSPPRSFSDATDPKLEARFSKRGVEKKLGREKEKGQELNKKLLPTVKRYCVAHLPAQSKNMVCLDLYTILNCVQPDYPNTSICRQDSISQDI